MKILAVLVGIGCIAAILFGLIWLGDKQYSAMHRPSNDVPSIPGLLLVVLIVLPVIYFLGSLPTGFMIEPHVEEDFAGLASYSPGLYLSGLLMLWVFVAAMTGMGTVLQALGACFMILVVILAWTAASWAGVVLGYKLRARIRRDDEF